ncbi:MAG: hypothetical protein AAF206_03435 [Bacteroidota bacterium]
MKRFQRHIQQALLDNEWEIYESDKPDIWWNQGVWQLQSKANPSCSCLISFITDPHDIQAALVVCVRASRAPLRDWHDTSTEIASLDIQKGRFDEKLDVFVKALEKFKRQT